MKTKSILVVALAALAVTAVAVDNGTKLRKKKGNPLSTGGFVELVNTGKVIQVANDRAACDARHFTASVTLAEQAFHYPFVTDGTSVTGPLGSNVAARVVFVSKDNQPRLLCAPEEGWCEINVKALLADSPNDHVAKKRIGKELVRALCFALGCGNSSVKPCIMDEVPNLGKLDELVDYLSPEAHGKTIVTARLRGCRPRTFTSYRKACEEGWAPAPTNDIQKAIWDKVHQLPTEPIKIKPEAKKVRE